MAEAYLMLRLDVSKKPPTVEEALITSSPLLTWVAPMVWAEVYSMQAATYDAAEKQILRVINSPRSVLAWAKPLLRKSGIGVGVVMTPTKVVKKR